MNPLDRQAAWDASKGRCSACGRALGADGVIHHRQGRGMGGRKGGRKDGSYADRPPLTEVIHDPCHKWVHAHPTRARETGHVVPSWADPAETPVTVIDELRTLTATPGWVY